MNNPPIGIGDCAVYLPYSSIQVAEIVRERIRMHPEMQRKLERALRSTGQEAIRFPQAWEDTVTMSAQAADTLIGQQGSAFEARRVRYIVVGTETTIDHSKPVSAYVEGILQRGGIDISENISTFQVQHACAGGTISLLSVGSILLARNRPQDVGLVICADIARYDTATTAEITQGAGAVALLVETSPRLIELDIASVGYSSHDVDDFFRPLGSDTARVKGSYSVECYHRALEQAFVDHCSYIDEAPEQVLRNTDLFALHVPFCTMGLMALRNLLTKFTEMSRTDIGTFLHERGFPQSTHITATVGNIYSGSIYLSLMSLLHERYATLGEDIVGRRLLLCSYGSGNTMTVLAGTVAERAPEVIRGWKLKQAPDNATPTSFAEYERWTRSTQHDSEYAAELDSILPGMVYLSNIREDGYREYRYRTEHPAT